MKPLTCSRCDEEVRWGTRDGVTSWLHREAVDHHTTLGTPWSTEYMAAIEAELDVERTRTVTRSKKVKGEKVTWTEEETYTLRDLNLATYRKAKKFQEMEAAEAAVRALEDPESEPDEDEEPESPLEPIEVYATPAPLIGSFTVEAADGPREVKVPGGARTVINLCEKVGWEVATFTYSRGPYLGASGGSLGVADAFRMVVRGPSVDGVTRYGVAWWRNAKATTAWRIEDGKTTPGGVRKLTDWMKEHPHGQ